MKPNLSNKKRTKNCIDCNREYEFEVHFILGKEYDLRSRCDQCDEIQEAEFRAEEERRRQQKIEDTKKDLPTRYRDSDENHPAFNRKLWARVKDWEPSNQKPWLGIVGEAGHCKTRCAVKWLERQVEESIEGSVSNAFIGGADFSRSVAQYDDAESRSKLAQLERARIVIFDDLGKIKPTAAGIERLFLVLEARMRNNLPMIWTANLGPSVIARRFPPELREEYTEPIVGRLGEASRVIVLK